MKRQCEAVLADKIDSEVSWIYVLLAMSLNKSHLDGKWCMQVGSWFTIPAVTPRSPLALFNM